MTVFLPLDPSTAIPPIPSFLVPPTNISSQLARTIQAIMKAKRIVVICGAGISVQAGIPDFRSSEGLFQTIKRDNPREAMSSGKELFDASVFSFENKTSLFCQMIAQLSDLSQAAEPTAFHHVLRSLDDRGRLLRVYTQNIDAIEQKCGLSFGVPELRSKVRSKGRSKSAPEELNATDDSPVASTSRLLLPPEDPPRCIPLHGTLQSMHCQVCIHSFPLLDFIPSLVSGQPPPCPECTSLETTRQLIGKRPRAIGRLRPSVVLYNEAHKDGEGVGDVVQKDLIGSSKGKGKGGADLLLVVGTSLKVPGTRRMVREFAKAVRSRGVGGASSKDEPSTPSGSSSRLATPAPSPRRSPTADEEPMPKAIYLNLDFPVPTREWEGVFDAWIQGDAQAFADTLQSEIEKEAKAKELATEKKRKRDEGVAAALAAEQQLPHIGQMHAKEKEKAGKRKSFETPQKSTKKRRAIMPPSPPYTPPSPRYLSPEPLEAGQDQYDDLPQSSKVYIRIPPLHMYPSYPEVYTQRTPPQYVRSYEFIRRRSITPPRSTIDVDMDFPPHLGIPHSPSPSPSPYLHSHHPQSHHGFSKHTKSGRKAIRDAQRARSQSRACTLAVPTHGYSSTPPPAHVQYRHHHGGTVHNSYQHCEDDRNIDIYAHDLAVQG